MKSQTRIFFLFKVTES